MLKNTRQAISRIGDDINIIKWLFSYGVDIFIVIYLIFALCSQIGDFIANCVLLVLTTIMLTSRIIYGKKELSKKAKKLQKAKLGKIKHAITVLKIVTKTYSLGLILYGMHFATVSVSAISVILTTITLLLWMMSVLLELVKLFFEKEKDLLFKGLEQDFEWLNKATNFVGDAATQVKEKVDDIKDSVVGFFKKENRDMADKK